MVTRQIRAYFLRDGYQQDASDSMADKGRDDLLVKGVKDGDLESERFTDQNYRGKDEDDGVE
jgi:hypothetical protein